MTSATTSLSYSFLDLQYNLALGGDLTPDEIMRVNERRAYPFRILSPWDWSDCMDNVVLTVAHALGVEVPRINPFWDPRLGDGTRAVPTSMFDEETYWRLYRAALAYFKTGELP